MPRDELDMFVVYQSPVDYPQHFVVRRWFIVKSANEAVYVPDSEFLLLFGSLESVQEWAYSLRLVFLSRSPEDDPVIVGTYI